MALSGVIFDLDGTLANTLPVCYAAFRRAYREFLGKEYTDAEIEATFGPSEEGALQRLIPDRWEAALAVFLTEYEAAHSLCTAPFPGLPDVLADLKRRGVRVAIVTGKGPRSAEISLRRTGLQPYFDIVEAGSPEGVVKPQAIGKILELWHLPASEVAYVGDAPADVDSARTAGVMPISAAWAPTADVEAQQAKRPAAQFLTVAAFGDWLAANTATAA